MKTTLLVLTLLCCAPAVNAACAVDSPLNTEAKRLLGPKESLCETYGGKVVLVVNTASQCGFTPQYEGLEKLWNRYRERGLVILGFPSDQFGDQEFAADEEIAKFCKQNFGVSFPMFTKTEVKGQNAHPLFQRLEQQTGSVPRWNFHKFLIGRDGRPIESFSSLTKPDSRDLRQAIETALAKP